MSFEQNRLSFATAIRRNGNPYAVCRASLVGCFIVRAKASVEEERSNIRTLIWAGCRAARTGCPAARAGFSSAVGVAPTLTLDFKS